MKAMFEFTNEEDYWDYLVIYFTSQVLPVLAANNIVVAEALAIRYATDTVKKLRNEYEAKG